MAIIVLSIGACLSGYLAFFEPDPKTSFIGYIVLCLIGASYPFARGIDCIGRGEWVLFTISMFILIIVAVAAYYDYKDFKRFG